MSKNAEGWIRHRGGKCPVEDGAVIEYRERNGNIEIECEPELLGTMWFHENNPHDIMAYRMHKPAEQVEACSKPKVYSGTLHNLEIIGQGGPLQWRDRITELDEERKTIDALYQVNITRIETERAELVQKLASEGFALIGLVVDPVEDMSDWRNWKVGDLITCMTDEYSDVYEKGKSYAVKEVKDSGALIFDDCGQGSCCTVGDKYMENFKFHSRPSA